MVDHGFGHLGHDFGDPPLNDSDHGVGDGDGSEVHRRRLQILLLDHDEADIEEAPRSDVLREKGVKQRLIRVWGGVGLSALDSHLLSEGLDVPGVGLVVPREARLVLLEDCWEIGGLKVCLAMVLGLEVWIVGGMEGQGTYDRSVVRCW